MVKKCPSAVRSGGKGAKLDVEFVRQKDENDGLGKALQEAVSDLKEAVELAEKNEEENTKLRAELEVARARRSVEVQQRLEGACFEVVLKTSDRWWVLVVLFLMVATAVGAAVAHLFVEAALGLIPALWWFRKIKWTETEVLGVRFERWLPDPVQDDRADAHSLQKLKYALPMMSEWVMYRTDLDEEEVLTVSGEVLLQITCGQNMSYVAKPEIVFERLFRAACGIQTVNVPKYLVGQSVHNHTALVAWVDWQSQRAQRLLDFAMRPSPVMAL